MEGEGIQKVSDSATGKQSVIREKLLWKQQQGNNASLETESNYQKETTSTLSPQIKLLGKTLQFCARNQNPFIWGKDGSDLI